MEKRKRQCEDSFYEFLLDAFDETHPGEVLTNNWHIRYLCDVLQGEIHRIGQGRPKTHDLIINIPPRSLKSFIASVALPAWSWIHYPHLKFISTSYSADLSVEHNMMTRDLIETIWYQSYWPHVSISSDENTKSKFSNTASGMRRATSTGGSITGSGGDVLTIDDPLNPKKAASEIERKAANDYFDKTLSTRLDHPEVGLFLIIMQRLHQDDLTGHCLEKDVDKTKYRHICIPAELGDNVQPVELREKYIQGLFFPNRFRLEYLLDQKAKLGSSAYAGQYNQRPEAEGGTMLKKVWFRYFALHELPRNLPWNFTLDGAYTKDKVNNASVILCYTMYQYDLYIRDVAVVWKSFPELIRFIPEFTMRNGYNRRSKIYIEPKANGISIQQMLHKNTQLNVILDKPPTTDKISRVTTAIPFTEAGRTLLLQDSAWVEPFLYELGIFPNGKEDGQVDCYCMAVDKVSLPKTRATFTFYEKREPTLQY